MAHVIVAGVDDSLAVLDKSAFESRPILIIRQRNARSKRERDAASTNSQELATQASLRSNARRKCS